MYEERINVLQSKDYSNEVPLSVIFANNEFLEQEKRLVNGNVQDFTKLCSMIPSKNMEDNVLVENIVKNALLVEFGDTLFNNPEIVEVISNAVLNDDELKNTVTMFANRHCSQKELDKTLIN